MELVKRFTFNAAHRLPNVPPEHKCSRMHGHTFSVEVKVRGDIDAKMGWIVDYAEIGEAWNPLFKMMDHQTLNEIDGLHNPTSENVARWIFHRLRRQVPGVFSVSVGETLDMAATFDVNDAAKDDVQ